MNLSECVRRAREGRSGGLPDVARDPGQAAPGFYGIGETVLVTQEPVAAPNPVPAPPQIDPEQQLLVEKFGLVGDDKEAFLAKIAAGEALVVEAYVTDYDKQDGDVVTIEAGGHRVDIPLKMEPTLVQLPLVAGKVAMIGKVDGQGGGVTVTISSLDGTKTLTIALAIDERKLVPFLDQRTGAARRAPRTDARGPQAPTPGGTGRVPAHYTTATLLQRPALGNHSGLFELAQRQAHLGAKGGYMGGHDQASQEIIKRSQSLERG